LMAVHKGVNSLPRIVMQLLNPEQESGPWPHEWWIKFFTAFRQQF